MGVAATQGAGEGVAVKKPKSSKLALFIAAAQAHGISIGTAKTSEIARYTWKRRKHVWGIEQTDLFGISISEKPKKMFILPQDVFYSSSLTIDCVAEFTFYQAAEDCVAHLKEILNDGIWETVNDSH